MSWISVLSPTNFASLSGARIAALRTEDFKALTKAQLGAMTADQIGAIEPIDMAVLTADKVAAFNPQALADGLVIYESNNPAGLPSKQMAALTGVQINKFSAELVSSLLPKMTAAQIGSISTTAIPRLGSSISTLSAAQLVGFTPLQKAVFTTAQNVAFSVEQLKNVGRLSPAQISAIDPSLISSIGNSALQSLNDKQLNAFTTAQISQLTTNQISSLKPEQISKLSAEWLNKLATGQVQSLGTPAIKALTVSQLKGLDPSHVTALSGNQVATLNGLQLGAFSANQIAAIDAGDIDAMSTGQFAALKQNQLKALTVGQIGHVNVTKAQAISPKDLASLSYQQIAAFDTNTVAHLSGAQLGALTPAQIANGLNADKIAALSTSQVKVFGTAQIQALTNPEVAAITLGDLSALSNSQLTAFTVNQLDHGFTNGQIGWISVNKLDAGFSAVQLNKIIERQNIADNAPTVAHAIANQNASQGSAFSFVVPSNTFADITKNDQLTYTSTKADGSELPSWISFNASTRTFSGTPANANVGDLNLKVTTTDLAGASVSSAFKVTVANVNDAPTVANAIANQNASQGIAFTFAVPSNTFADVDTGDQLTYTATKADGSALPSWISFNASTRTFSGTPAIAHVGDLNLKVTATDVAGASVSSAFKISVPSVNHTPTVANAIADQTTNQSSVFSFAVPSNTFADVDTGDQLTYTATQDDGTSSPLPSWISFNASTRTFSGTPANADVGNLNLKVTATDVAGASVSSVFKITVANVNGAPTVANAIANQNTSQGTAFTFAVPSNTFADVDTGDQLTFTATKADGSALPSWLTFVASTRTFSGTPAIAHVGDLNLKVTATDVAGASVSSAFTITVAVQSVIDLGAYGKLIAPVQVEGAWYYYWDRSGNGTSANTGSLNGGVDYTTHDVLDGIFTSTLSEVNAGTTGTGTDTTDLIRYATLNGVKVALPTANGGVAVYRDTSSYQESTPYTDAGVRTNGTTGTFNELLAIWDAYNGTGVGRDAPGAPPGWQATHYDAGYWSATPSGGGGHVVVKLDSGAASSYEEFSNFRIALQAL